MAAAARSTCLIVVFLLVSATYAARISRPAKPFVFEEATIAETEAAFAAKTLTCRGLVEYYFHRIAVLEDRKAA